MLFYLAGLPSTLFVGKRRSRMRVHYARAKHPHRAGSAVVIDTDDPVLVPVLCDCRIRAPRKVCLGRFHQRLHSVSKCLFFLGGDGVALSGMRLSRRYCGRAYSCRPAPPLPGELCNPKALRHRLVSMGRQWGDFATGHIRPQSSAHTPPRLLDSRHVSLSAALGPPALPSMV